MTGLVTCALIAIRNLRSKFFVCFSRGNLARLKLLSLIIIGGIASAQAADQYAYDDAGRLVQWVQFDGYVVSYIYDSNGNVTLVNRTAANTLAVSGFSPASARINTDLTIYGAAFSTTPAANIVTIGGASAAVVSATKERLVVTIPSTAATGPIAVTANGVTVSSGATFVVLRPVITSFSPTFVNTGTSITLTGTSLNLVPGSTSVSVGGTVVTPSSLTNTQATFAAPNVAGLISVSTPYGQTTSTTALAVLSNAISSANVAAIAPIAVGGSDQTLSANQQSKQLIYQFNASQGQLLSLQISSLVTTPVNSMLFYMVYSPSGASIATGSVNSSTMSIHLPVIPVAGTYLVAIGSGNTTSLQVTASVEVNAVLNDNGSTTNVSTATAGQSKRFVIAGIAGQSLGLGVTGLVVTPASINNTILSVYKPDGSGLTSTYDTCYTTTVPGCQISLRNLPVSGNYTIFMAPNGAATFSSGLTLSQNVMGVLAAGTPVNLNLAAPGQNALLTFTATAGQTIALNMGGVATTPTGKAVYAYVYNASGTQVASINGAGTANLPNLAAGTYSVLVAPQYAATATLHMTLANGLTAALPVDGGTSSTLTSTVVSQNGYFTFAGTAGQNLGLGITNILLAPSSVTSVVFNIDKPDGSGWLSTTCYTSNGPSCQVSLRNLPVAGNYTVRVVPNGQATMSFNLTLSQDVSGALALNTPLNLNLAVPGQNALVTFIVSAGQKIALNMGAVATTPTGKAVYAYVYNASGTQVASINATSAASATANLPNLAAGTYSVMAAPQSAATATLQMTLANGLTATLPVDGSTSSALTTTIQGQYGYFTFAGTAGQNFGLGITNLLFIPSSVTYANISVDKPDGSAWQSFICYTSNLPGCQVSLSTLPVTGNYTVRVMPGGQATMSVNLTLSQDVSRALTMGTPTSVNLAVPGQNALLTFVATAGQTVTLSIASTVTTPAGKPVLVYVCNASGTQVGSKSITSSTTATLSLPSLSAGTYTIFVVPQYAALATFQLSLQ